MSNLIGHFSNLIDRFSFPIVDFFHQLMIFWLDLLFIDGGPRAECLKNGFIKVKSGGYIYLDNWENISFWEGAAVFIESVGSHIAESRTFIDYVPAQVGVYEGKLIRKR